jgi:hypothetical protein
MSSGSTAEFYEANITHVFEYVDCVEVRLSHTKTGAKWCEFFRKDGLFMGTDAMQVASFTDKAKFVRTVYP